MADTKKDPSTSKQIPRAKPSFSKTALPLHPRSCHRADSDGVVASSHSSRTSWTTLSA